MTSFGPVSNVNLDRGTAVNLTGFIASPSSISNAPVPTDKSKNASCIS